MRALLSLLLLLFALPGFGRGQDVIHLKSGEVIRCEIVAITDNILTYKTTIDLGGGRSASAQPTISPEAVAYIEFAPLPGEAELLARGKEATLDALESLWDEKSRHLHRPRSNAGEIGLRYGQRLLVEPDSFQWKFALGVFDRLLERDWNPGNRKEATKGRLRALIQLGELDQAKAEALQLAQESEDPEMLIEARLALGLADFERLRKLEEENPRWEEDETVRPERERLYHSVIDQFLWPFLFHGTEEDLAARGLVRASEVHQFGQDEASARACLEDVITLYPNSPEAETATQRLNEKVDAPSSPNETDDDDSNETEAN